VKKRQDTEVQITHWKPPCEGVYKINTDASFKEQTNSGGWGSICRDSEYDICFAVAGPLINVTNAFQAEAIALSNAIDVADRLGVGKVTFETDCINLKNAMTSSEYDFGLLDRWESSWAT
jgi:ribonuclease HI